MKKVLLSSVAALAVFTAASPVFANNDGAHYSKDDNKVSLEGKDIFGKEPAELTQYAKDGLNNVDADSTKAKFKAAGEDLKPIPGKPGEFVVTGKAKAAAKKADAKAGAAAGQKALPKTSAAK